MNTNINFTPHDIKMLKGVLDTMKCISSNRKNMPGMSLENIISSSSVNDVESETQWLETLLNKLDVK